MEIDETSWLNDNEITIGDISINFDSLKDDKDLMIKFLLSLDNFKLKISVSPMTKDESKLFGYQYDSSIKPALEKEQVIYETDWDKNIF
tara:strand:+ start:570 stop:836 length:267 start_codon:yes stop_codon:yes gene_type:complete